LFGTLPGLAEKDKRSNVRAALGHGCAQALVTPREHRDIEAVLREGAYACAPDGDRASVTTAANGSLC
jgi:hypothetical protein